MIEDLVIQFGAPAMLCVAGLLVGVVFGAAAQHSRFCLRAATAEFSARVFGPRLAVWLITFAAALMMTQGLISADVFNSSQARQIAGTGSLSGAIIGGLMFGIGMVLARGCASRLLVLSATGNLRAIVTGLVLTLVAQASLSGALAPAREVLFGLWTISGGPARDMMTYMGVGHGMVTAVATGLFALALWLGVARRVGATRIFAAALVGGAVALGWGLTYLVQKNSFELVQITSVTFTGPSADTLMSLINTREVGLNFSLGLVPGVFVGAGLMALLTGEFKIQRFGEDTPMERYLIGAALMGFGSMLAGGCAVGAGVSGGAIMALTAWIAVFCMWVGAVATTVVLGWVPERVEALA